MNKPLEDGDFNGLVTCMGYLMSVKERQQTTDAMFEPIKQMLELLNKYDQEMPEEVYTQIQVGNTVLRSKSSRNGSHFIL